MLDGRWGAYSLGATQFTHAHGYPPSFGLLRGLALAVHWTRFVVHAPSGEILLYGSFRLGASTDPKAVDWIDDCGPDAGKVLPAIYRLEGERLVFRGG